MLKLGLAVTALVAAGAFPATHVLSPQKEPRTMERTLLAHVNSGPSGQITRQINCKSTSAVGHTFKCDLDSVRSTRIRASVAVGNGGLSLSWQPIEG